MSINVSSIKEHIIAKQSANLPLSATNDVAMKNAFITSGALHIVILVIAAIGIPFLAKDEPLIITPISIELVDIADITQTNRRAPPKPEKPIEIERPQPPQKIEPKPQPIPEPPAPEPEPVIEDVKEQPPEPEPIIEPKKETPKPKPKPKEPEKPKEQPKPKENAFDSLLKDLTPDEADPAQPTPDKTVEDVIEDTAGGQIANLSDKLSISELDAFKYQLEPCWNVPAGAKFAENLAVEVRVTLLRDGTVNKASVLNRARYNSDSSFRAAADSALRALRNPRCSPLRLPPEKYDQWKSIVINFDPKNML